MKKINFVLSLILILLSGIFIFSGFSSPIANVSAEINTEFVNMTLTGGQESYPYHYFDSLEQATYSSAAISYYNKNKEKVNSYRAIIDEVKTITSFKYSTGEVTITLLGGMKQLATTGRYFVYASAGLLALKDEGNSKIKISLSVDEVTKSATSNLVYNGGDYRPDWVQTDKIYITNPDQTITFKFTNREASSIWNGADFLIFEPMITFGYEIDQININVENTNVSPGQLVKLNALNSVTQLQGEGQLLNYYKNYFKIEWEIIQGADLANISGNYLNITGQSGLIKVRAKCRSNTENNNYIYSSIITYRIDNSMRSLNLISNFEDGATLFGAGNYTMEETQTAIFTETKKGYTFLGYEDESGNSIDYTITTKGSFRAVIDLNSSRTIYVKLKKDIKINEIIVKDKYYDKSDKAEIKIEDIKIYGISNGHDVIVNSTLTGMYSDVLPADNIYIILTGEIAILGPDSWMYNLNCSLPDTFGKILKRPVTIAANDTEKEYNMEDPIFTYSISSGNLLAGDFLIGNLSRDAGEDLGEYEINLGTLNNPYYDITFLSGVFKITKGQISIINVSVDNKIYDKTNLISKDNIELTLSGNFANHSALKYEAVFEDFNVGTNLMVLFNAWIEGDLAEYYNLTIEIDEIRASILPKSITIIADNKSKIYGEDDPLLTYSYNEEDLLDGDIITGSISRSVGEYAGTYMINRGSLISANYEINFITADFIIHPREIEVVAESKTKIYGEQDPELTYVITNGELINGDSLGLTLKRTGDKNVGEYNIIIDSQMNINYRVIFKFAIFTITKRDMKISIYTKEKQYDGKLTGNIIAEYSNLIIGDEILLNFEAIFEDLNASLEDKSIIYFSQGFQIENFNETILLGDDIQNYDFTFQVSYISRIHKKEIVLQLSDDAVITKKYADPDIEIKYCAEGVAEGETLVGSLARTEGENVGTYFINQGTITNENNPNYLITFECNKFFEIFKRPVIIIINNKEITYGEQEGEIVYYLSQKSPLPDEVQLERVISGRPSRELANLSNAGIYNYLIGSLMINSEFKNNYELIFSGGCLTINKRSLDININNLTKTYGEDDPIISYIINSGFLINANDLIFSREEGENVGIYSIMPVLNENYEIIYNKGSLEIIPVYLAIKANNLLKIYGNNDPNLTFTISDGTLMFDDTPGTVFSGSLERVKGEEVGSYIINQGNLKASSNYLMNFAYGVLNIQKKNIIIEANSITKFIDDETDVELTYNVIGLIENDTLTGKLEVEEINGLGEYNISIGSLNGENYNITFVEAKVFIVKRNLYIFINYISREYDGTSRADLTYSLDGDIDEDDQDNLEIILSKEDGYNVGKYLITASCSNEKYNVITTKNYFEILPRKITIKANDIEITYGDSVPDQNSWTYSVEGQIINNEIKISLYRTQNYCAGTFDILGTVINTNNYDVTFIPGKLIINKKTIYITVNNYQKIYGHSDPSFEYIIDESVLYNNDILEGTITREEGENTNIYNLICSLINDNYEIVMNKATLTILPKELILVAAALDKTYDGTDVAYLRTPSLSGIILGDDVNLDYPVTGLARFENINVGDSKSVIVYGGELVGADAQNYYLTRPTNLKASITISQIEDKNGEVMVSASKTNTKLKVGTTLSTTKVETEEKLFGDSKSIVNAYCVELLYNDEVFENYGSLTVSINLGMKEHFNVQLYKIRSDGELELIKSNYKDGKIVFSTDNLGTYIVIADNDGWMDYTLIGICGGFAILIGIIIFLNKNKILKTERRKK